MLATMKLTEQCFLWILISFEWFKNDSIFLYPKVLVKFQYGDTPLHTAARYGHAGIARILISARCSIEEQNKNGDTALHITAAFKRRKIAKLLIEGGIGHSVRNKVRLTFLNPLWLTCLTGT